MTNTNTMSEMMTKVKVSKQGFRNYVAIDTDGKDVEATRSYCAHLARIKYRELAEFLAIGKKESK